MMEWTTFAFEAGDLVDFVFLFIFIVLPILRRLFGKKKDGEEVPQPTQSTEKPSTLGEIKRLILEEMQPEQDEWADFEPEPDPGALARDGAQIIDRLHEVGDRAARLSVAVRDNEALLPLSPPLDILGRDESHHLFHRVEEFVEEGNEGAVAHAAETTRGYEALLDDVGGLLQARSEGAHALAHADALVKACYQPFIDLDDSHDLGLSVRSAVAVPMGEATSPRLPRRHSILASVAVPFGASPDPRDWWITGARVGVDLLRRLPDLRLEMDSLVPGNPNAPPPGWDGTITASDVDNLIAAWSRVLFGDIIGALLLGPTVLNGLLETWGHTADPFGVDIDWAQGRIHPMPPLAARVSAAAHVHRFLDYDSNEILAMRGVALPDDAVLKLPVAGEQVAHLPLDYVDDRIGELVQRALDTPFESLYDHPLTGVNGVPFSDHMHQGALRIARTLNRKKHVACAPRVWLAAVVSALGERPSVPEHMWSLYRKKPARRRIQQRRATGRKLGRREELRLAVAMREAFLPPLVHRRSARPQIRHFSP